MSRRIRVYSVVSDSFRYGFFVMAKTLLEHNGHHDIALRVVYHPELSPLSDDNRAWLQARLPNLEFHVADLENYRGLFKLRDEVFETPRRLWAAFFILEAFADDFEGDVLSLDSDMICLGPLEDDLFPASGFGAIEARLGSGEGLGYYNTGVMSIARDRRGRAEYDRIVNHTDASSYDPNTGRADQALLSLIYRPSNSHALPWRYNVTRRHVPRWGIEADLEARRAVFFHFVGAKPWHASLDKRDVHGGDAEALWDRTVERVLTPQEYKAYLEFWRDTSRDLAREHVRDRLTPRLRIPPRKNLPAKLFRAVKRRIRRLVLRMLGRPV